MCLPTGGGPAAVTGSRSRLEGVLGLQHPVGAAGAQDSSWAKREPGPVAPAPAHTIPSRYARTLERIGMK